MRAFLARVVVNPASLAVDAVALGGAACVVYGLVRIYEPAAWILAGAALIAISIILAKR